MTGSLVLAGAALADDSPPANLGNGLSTLVQPPRNTGHSIRMVGSGSLAIRDRAGRVLVDVYARPGESVAAVRQRAEASGLSVVKQSADARAIEGFVSVANVSGLARVDGVASVSQALRPQTHVGAATSQGVHAERADRVGGIDGRGITVGALSDSYDQAQSTVDGAPLTIHAAQDIKTGDLPKNGVTVIEDDNQPDFDTDEGRAMLQILHDMAPGARECFATADISELDFADNIRKLADKSGPCGADVITDDIFYFDEPFFGDDKISDAIDDVTAHGVSYFSSAGNESSNQAYDAPLRIVPPTKPGDRSNIKLDQVSPNLYAGGFHDFDPGPGVDVAQDLALGDDTGQGELGALDVQWDDPLDPNGATFSDPTLQDKGSLTAPDSVVSFPYDGKAGETIDAVADADPPGSDVDVVISLIDPAGKLVSRVDNTTSPEELAQTLQQTGRYTIEISGFDGSTGNFTLVVRDATGLSRVTTDLNALIFDADGNFVGAGSDFNKVTGRPMELPVFFGAGPAQVVIAKGSTDPGQATRVAYQIVTDTLQETEYVDPLGHAIVGHAAARGANAVAAQDPFPPFMPEDFTSVGGDLPILFDSDGNRLPSPDIRRKPEMSATDGGNTTFFVSDSVLDPDNQPNFFGTSAAAPHAAGVAALALQAAGGPGSISPAAMRTLLQRSAFPHDLDEMHSAASGGGLSITADAKQGRERVSIPVDEVAGGMTDPDVFKVSYSGPGSLVSLTFDGANANPTGFVRRQNRSAGLVFDPRPFLAIPALGGPELFTQGFPFTVGAVSPGIDPSAITASFDRPGVAEANRSQFQRMTVRFPAGALGGGRAVAFGVDRDEAATAVGDAEAGNSADALGAGVLVPDGTVAQGGLTYRAVTSTGRVLAGTLRNRIGAGFSPVDGFGYLNAEAAVARARGRR